MVKNRSSYFSIFLVSKHPPPKELGTNIFCANICWLLAYVTLSLRGESHPQHTYILYGRNHVAEHILGLETVNIEWMYHISRYSRLKMVCVCGRWPQQIMPYHQHCENISEIVIVWIFPHYQTKIFLLSKSPWFRTYGSVKPFGDSGKMFLETL